MSINISSDDEESTAGGLPSIGFQRTVLISASPRLRRHSSSTVELYESDKENIVYNCVDLTQGSISDDDNEPVVLGGSSTRSQREGDSGRPANARQRSASVQSDSTMELVDSDAAFNQLFPIASLQHMDSGVSVQSGSSRSTASTSSGYGSGITGRRKSVDSVYEKPKRKNTEADRVTKKQMVEEERLARLAANEVNKIYKPGECMKYMQIEVHPTLHQAWYLADLQREATASGARVVPSADIFHEGLVVWSRRTERRLAARAGQVELTNAKEPCDRALLVQRAEDIAPYVKEHTLSSHVGRLRDIVGCRLTMVVFGVKDYFKSSGRKKQNNRALITEIELEMAFTDLLVTADCDAVVVNTASELALTVVQFTKAIAEAPHKQAKRACDEQADFYMRGDNKKCVAVDKDGHGLARLWQQMLAVLPHSSLEISRAICQRYKSPVAMCEALQRANAVNELSDVGVDRAGPGSRARRLGPEFARRLHTLLTADDGSMLVE